MNGEKRYTLVSYHKRVEKEFSSGKTRYEILKIINEYNNRTKNEYFISNIKTEKYKITFDVYKKLAEKDTLDNIDKQTTELTSEELEKKYNTNSPIYIAYKMNKEIKLLKVFTREYKKYLNRQKTYLKYMIYFREKDFLRLLTKNEKIKEISSYINSKDFYSVYNLIEKLEYKDKRDLDSIYIINFYNTFVKPKRKFSYYNFRLLAEVLLMYENSLKEKEEQKDTFEPIQLPIKEFESIIDKEEYENKKLNYRRH